MGGDAKILIGVRASPRTRAALMLVQHWLLLRLGRKPSLERVVKFLLTCFSLARQEEPQIIERAINAVFHDGRVRG